MSLLSLCLPLLLVGNPPSIGDPRTRGGAQDLFGDDEDEQENAFDEIGPRTFRLRAAPGRRVAQVAVTPSGRYAAYALEGSRGWRLVVVDTASASLRAVGPELEAPPVALAVGAGQLAWVERGSLVQQPWWAAATPRDALERKDEGKSERLGVPLDGAHPDALTVSASGTVALTAHRSGAEAVLVVAGPQKADTIELATRERCPALTFASRDKIIFALCRSPEGAVVHRIGLLADGPRAEKELPFLRPASGFEAVAISSRGAWPLVAWAQGAQGRLTGRDRQGRSTDLRLPFAPLAVVVREPHAVVAGAHGQVSVVGLEGGSLVGIDGPELGGAQLPAPALAKDGSVAVFAADRRHPEHRQPKLFVIPALR